MAPSAPDTSTTPRRRKPTGCATRSRRSPDRPTGRRHFSRSCPPHAAPRPPPCDQEPSGQCTTLPPSAMSRFQFPMHACPSHSTLFGASREGARHQERGRSTSVSAPTYRRTRQAAWSSASDGGNVAAGKSGSSGTRMSSTLAAVEEVAAGGIHACLATRDRRCKRKRVRERDRGGRRVRATASPASR